MILVVHGEDGRVRGIANGKSTTEGEMKSKIQSSLPTAETPLSWMLLEVSPASAWSVAALVLDSVAPDDDSCPPDDVSASSSCNLRLRFSPIKKRISK